MCGSGQQAVHFGAQAILAGDMDLVIAGGIEMMSHQPIGADWPLEWPPDFPYPLVHQGISAEMMAKGKSNTEKILTYHFPGAQLINLRQETGKTVKPSPIWE